ncbi:MAG: hypothetical protein N4A40_09180 [Tissierellales bacterium]|jgi:hypothetical protein|nr:hypothetical protein [Tissierellales bacterium]
MKKESYRCVEYYEGADMAKGYMLKKSKEVYERLDSNYLVDNINEAIELYTIDKYVKDGLLLQYLGLDNEEWLKEKNGIAKASVGRYIGSHQNILAEYEKLDFGGKETFWKIIGERKLSSINENNLKQVLDEQEHFVWQIFKLKKVVMYFDTILRDYMMENPEGNSRGRTYCAISNPNHLILKNILQLKNARCFFNFLYIHQFLRQGIHRGRYLICV